MALPHILEQPQPHNNLLKTIDTGQFPEAAKVHQGVCGRKWEYVQKVS